VVFYYQRSQNPLTIRLTYKPFFYTPNMNEEKPASATAKTDADLISLKTFESRTVMIFGEITDSAARDITQRLIALDAESSKPITVLVSSPGGHVESGDAIHDVVRYIRSQVRMLGTGWVGSAAAHLFLAADAKTIADATGQALEKVMADIEHDHWLSAVQAVEYGLGAKIIEHRSELPD